MLIYYIKILGGLTGMTMRTRMIREAEGYKSRGWTMQYGRRGSGVAHWFPISSVKF